MKRYICMGAILKCREGDPVESLVLIMRGTVLSTTVSDGRHSSSADLKWRAWGACYIQEAWRRYCKKKLGKSLRKEENRLQDSLAEAGGSSPAQGSGIDALRSAANALNHVRNSDRRRPMLVEKPADSNDSE
ncbi:hypothetical protein ACFX13_002165 [Malus domestica]